MFAIGGGEYDGKGSDELLKGNPDTETFPCEVF